MSKISVFVKMTARDGRRDDLVAALEDVRPLIDAEDGAEMYTFHRDRADENVVWMFELYTDQAGLDAHGSGEVLKALGASLRGVLAAAPEVHYADAVSSKGLDA
jgi:quinol monooxygenase YgiN